jgi:AraC-like DNA-binding protein
MRATRRLVDRPDFSVHAVACRDDHTGWSAVEPARGYGLVLVRSGGFRRRSRAGETFVDPTLGYLTLPRAEEQFAHPAGGDDCTAVHVSAVLWAETVGERPTPDTVYVDAGIDLAHRLLRRAVARPEPDFGAAERLVALLARVAGAPSTVARQDRRTVQSAREALRAGHPAATGLVPLARLLGVSPYRLSRSFRALVGVPLTRYRNRLRVGAALDRLEQGTDDLAGLAAELGFADQAHLTRTVRAHLGHTPGELRRLLS